MSNVQQTTTTINNATDPPQIGDKCEINFECQESDPESFCLEGFCDCVAGTFYHGNKCRKGARLGDRCTETRLCELVQANTVCKLMSGQVIRQCICRIGFQQVNNSCVSTGVFPHLGERCDLDIDCQMLVHNSICETDLRGEIRCSCPLSFDENGNACEPASDASVKRAFLASSFVFVVILFAIAVKIIWWKRKTGRYRYETGNIAESGVVGPPFLIRAQNQVPPGMYYVFQDPPPPYEQIMRQIEREKRELPSYEEALVLQFRASRQFSIKASCSSSSHQVHPTTMIASAVVRQATTLPLSL